MENSVVILAVVLWVFSGTFSFIYWWLKQFDLVVADVFFSIVGGVCFGPFAFLLGYLMSSSCPKIFGKVIKKKVNK